MIVKTVINSLPDIGNVFGLLIIMLFVFAIVGITLFGSVLPDYFGNLGYGTWWVFALCVCVFVRGLGWVLTIVVLQLCSHYWVW